MPALFRRYQANLDTLATFGDCRPRKTIFYVVCDASDFAVGCALMQYDTDGAERVVCYQSRQQRVKPSSSFVQPCSLYLSRQSAGSPFPWTSSSVSPKTLTRIMVFLCSWTGSARWCILLLYPSRSRHRAVLVSLSTRYFDSTGYPVNSCPTVTLGSRRSFGNPCSDHSELD